MDKYSCFAELRAREREGVDFQVRVQRRGNVSTVILAPHGGGIEPGTSEVAVGVAGEELSFGAFEGVKRAGNGCLHITSIRFDEPRCLELVRSANRVVTIHGEGSGEKVVFLGGSDAELGNAIRAGLQQHGYTVRIHTDSQLLGLDPLNICNRGTRGIGVQLELSAGLRASLFASLKSKGRRSPTMEFGLLTSAIRQGLREAGAL